MYASNSIYEQSDRSITLHLYYYDYGRNQYVQLSDTKIVSCKITESIAGNGTISFGTANSSSADIQLSNITIEKDKFYKKVALKLSMEATDSASNSETTPLGVFYIDEIKWNEFYDTSADGYNAQITAYDGFYLAEKEMSTGILPLGFWNERRVAHSIATNCGVGINDDDWQGTNYAYTAGYSSISSSSYFKFSVNHNKTNSSTADSYSGVHAYQTANNSNFYEAVGNQIYLKAGTKVTIAAKFGVTTYGSGDHNAFVGLARGSNSYVGFVRTYELGSYTGELGDIFTINTSGYYYVYVHMEGLASGSYIEDITVGMSLSSMPDGTTQRTMLGYLAGLSGNVAYFDRNGKLGTKWYTLHSPQKQITTEEQYLDGVDITDSRDADNVTVIKILETGTSEDVITKGESGVVGAKISFANPLITDQQASEVYTNRIYESGTYKIQYVPLSVTWRGNPNIECGEKIIIYRKDDTTQNTFYLMERQIEYDGGLSETYTCYGEKEQSVSYQTTISPVTLNRRYSAMETAIKEATELIGNVDDSQLGVFTIIPSADGTYNTGWKIKSEHDGKVILANRNGIGFSSNGGQSFNAAAIYIDSNGVGHINANQVTVDNLTTQMITFDTSSSDNHFINATQAALNTGIAIGNGTIQGVPMSTIISDQNTNINSAVSSASSAQNAASSAQNTANAVDAKIANWAYSNNVTYIDGAKIYTGSITTQQLRVGWVGSNIASTAGYTEFSGSPFGFSYNSSGSYTGPYAILSQSSADSYHAVGAKVYMPANTRVTIKAQFNVTTYGSGQHNAFVGLAIDHTQNSYAGYVSTTTSSSQEKTTTFDISSGGYYYVYVFMQGLAANSVIQNIRVSYSMPGDLIVNGVIRSDLGNSYFNLETGELAASGRKWRTVLFPSTVATSDLTYDTQGLYFLRNEDAVTDSTPGYLRWTNIANSSTNATSGKLYSNDNLVVESGNALTLKAGSSGIAVTGAVTFNNDVWASSNLRVSGTIFFGDTNNYQMAVNNYGTLMYYNSGTWSSVMIEPTDPSNWWVGSYKVATGANFSGFMSDRASHIKVNVGGTVYTAYWS